VRFIGFSSVSSFVFSRSPMGVTPVPPVERSVEAGRIPGW
jgi:hypothetical protein